MNKIKVVNNMIIPYDNDDISIYNNNITFLQNGNYIIEYIDSNDISLNIKIDKNKCINLFEYSTNNNIILNNKYYLLDRSSLIISKFYSNASTSEVINVYLDGKDASIKYNFSSISSGIDKYTISIYHNKDNTRSDIYNRTVAKKGSSNHFDINSFVDNGIIDTYLNQHTKIIALGESGNRINPNMYTHDNSTTAIHASAIGNIDGEDLFYLMSRGINYKDSLNLIIKGIILGNINIPDEYRQKIIDILNVIGGE